MYIIFCNQYLNTIIKYIKHNVKKTVQIDFIRYLLMYYKLYGMESKVISKI